MLKRATDLFPLWAVLFAGLALWQPGWFAPGRPAITWLLGVIMFGMGITLHGRDFLEVLRAPLPIGLGAALQFGLMPLFAFAVARLLHLPTELTAGLVLVGSCPGGTASNVICYLARADVALSISLTALSTLVAIVATPLLTDLYVGRAVEVDVPAMIGSIFRIVLVPVTLGVTLNAWLGGRLEGVKRFFPLLSVAAIVAVIAIVVALSHERIRELSGLVFLAVALHNALGLAGGYAVPKLLRLPEAQCRTIAIEVGMQNSGLGVALAVKYFSAAAALPGAVFSVWHNLTGSLLAARWSRGQA